METPPPQGPQKKRRLHSDDANPASPPTSPSAATVPPASPRSLPATPTIKSPPTHAPPEPTTPAPRVAAVARRSPDGAERASRALPTLRERVTFMRRTSRDAGVIHPNLKRPPRRL